MRCYQYKCKHFGKPIPQSHAPITDLTDRSVIKFVIAHWHEKLKKLLLEGFIRTEAGKKCAQKGHLEMEAWVKKWEMKVSQVDGLTDYQETLLKIQSNE
jgi:NADPH-dependent curcumin reductase CurA